MIIFLASEFLGSFLTIKSNSTNNFDILQQLQTNGTSFSNAFRIEEENTPCSVFITGMEQCALIYCITNSKEFLSYVQKLDCSSTKSTVLYVGDETFFIIISGSWVKNWKFNRTSKKFDLKQITEILNPISITSFSYKGSDYVAIASGWEKSANYTGGITIQK